MTNIHHAEAQTPQRNVDSLLCAVRERDQKSRMDLMAYYAKGDVDSVVWCSRQIESADAGNQRAVFGIFDAEGWPEGFSDGANSAISLVIDHADVEAQNRYCRYVARAARHGCIGCSFQVTLRDRILMYTKANVRYTVRRPYLSPAVTARCAMCGP